MTKSRIELFSKCPVNVFAKERNASDFCREIAEMKVAQGDNQPFYVMHAGSVINALTEWFQCLPRIRPFYSLHCNDDPVLLRILASHPNVGFHCVKREHIETALELVSSRRVLYGNHLWTRGSLRTAAENNVGLLSFESIKDLDRISLVYPDADLILNVSINPNVEDTRADLGCSIEEASEILQHAFDIGVNVRGISFHVGSGCRDPSIFFKAIGTCSELFHFGNSHGLVMDYLNIGGGFFNGSIEDYASFDSICKEINSALDYFFPSKCYPNLNIIAQPGRFFASDGFNLVTNIISKKAVDLSIVTNDDYDTGIQAYVYQINDGFYGSFGCRLVAHCEPKCSPLFSSSDDNYSSEHFYGSVIGPTSDEYDIAQSLCHLRQMHIGEWLIWPQMGAYSRNNRGSLGDVDIPKPTVYYYCDENEWQMIENMTSNSLNYYSNSIDTTCDMSVDYDESGFSDFSDSKSQTDESVLSTEDWIARWPFQEPIEIFQ